MPIIKTHDITLTQGDIILRPLCDDHIPLLLKWGQDMDVQYWVDGPDAEPLTPESIGVIWGQVSQSGLCFLIEHKGHPIGECWLQEMHEKQRKINLIEEPLEFDVRRIDMSIGEKTHWGQGVGGAMISMLVQFAFEEQNVDVLYGLTFDYNKRSQRVFEKNGFQFVEQHQEGEQMMAKHRLTRQEYVDRCSL